MSIANLIASNVNSLISSIKQFTSNPKINGIPIQANVFRCRMEAEVSRHVLINLTNGLENVMDNVAPGPRTWQIEGYIGGLPGELTSLYMPSLVLVTNLFDTFFRSRQSVNLIDPSFRSFTVLISDFEYSGDPATQNRVPVKIGLVEITVLKASVGAQVDVPTDQSNASPVPGQAGAPPAAAGSTAPLALPTPPALQSNPGLVFGTGPGT